MQVEEIGRKGVFFVQFAQDPESRFFVQFAQDPVFSGKFFCAFFLKKKLDKWVECVV